MRCFSRSSPPITFQGLAQIGASSQATVPKTFTLRLIPAANGQLDSKAQIAEIQSRAHRVAISSAPGERPRPKRQNRREPYSRKRPRLRFL